MNENEFLHLHGIYSGKHPCIGRIDAEHCATLFSVLVDKLPGVSLILHLTDSAISVDPSGSALIVKNHFIEQPVILIGGGDNFNAGFCFGLLHGEDTVNCMALAGAVGSYYVEFGHSPDRQELSAYLIRLHDIIGASDLEYNEIR
jgi:sugar/nucleoside kinase (ribokinase family)